MIYKAKAAINFKKGDIILLPIPQVVLAKSHSSNKSLWSIGTSPLATQIYAQAIKDIKKGDVIEYSHYKGMPRPISKNIVIDSSEFDKI